MKAVLVCIDGHPKSHLLVEQGFRKAHENGLSVVILNVVTPGHTDRSVGQAGQLIRLLESSAEKGAEVVQVSSDAREPAILDHLETQRSKGIEYSTVITGSLHHVHWWRTPLRKDFAAQLIKRFGDSIEIVSMPLTRQSRPGLAWREWVLQLPTISDWGAALSLSVLVFGAIFIAATNLVGFVPYVQDITQAALLLSAVFFSYRYGFLVAVFFAVPVPLALEYILPNWTGVNFYAYWLDMLVLGFMSAVIAYLSSNQRASASRMGEWQERTQATYSVLSSAMEATNSQQLFDLLERELSGILGADVVFLLPDQPREERQKKDEVPSLQGTSFKTFPEQADLSEKEEKLALACWDTGSSTGYGTLKGIASEWRFELMSTPVSRQGVIGVRVPTSAKLNMGYFSLLSDLSDHIAIQVAHQSLLSVVHTKEFLAEREHLRSMLLSSVSHDLKTPLSSIIGSLRMTRSLRARGKLTETNALELEDTAIAEAERLERFISNILSMTEIDSGYIKFNMQPCDPTEPLRVARRAVKSRYKGRSVSVETGGEPYEVTLDPMLTAQILQNLLENAAKYSPEGAPVTVKLKYASDGLYLKVRDEGPGIPEDRLESIFDKHERLAFADSKVAGTGLGLAIAKAVMEGQGGHIAARNAKGAGAEFELFFPKT